jgi:NADPH:quinone reductase-like Zn-dependent oxidoreductase
MAMIIIARFKRAIQYPPAPDMMVQAFPSRAGILDRPVKPGDDSKRCTTLDPTLLSARNRGNAALGNQIPGSSIGANRAATRKLQWHAPSTMIRTPEPRRRTGVNATTMKALVLRRHGGLSDLEVVDDYSVPRAAEGHVVVRVRASSFNYHDVFTMRGMPGIKVPLPVVIGLDMAGEIVEVGAGVSSWKPGDRVLVNPLNKKKGLMGEMLDGGMAQYCLVSVDQLVAMPAHVTFEEAASLPVAYGTAHRMLITHDTVARGERVIVLGASGGVGTGCVILAKHLGAEVIACASSADKMKRLKELGADEVINYQEVDFSKWAIERYGKPQRRSYEGGVDVVINFTGGDTWQPSLRCLKRGGKLLVCGATAGHDPKEDLRYVWTFELKIIGSNSFYDDDLKGLMELIAEGKMKPVIDKVLPLEQAVEGLRLIQDREVFGKVVVTP